MAVRRPLVLIAGIRKELPLGDTLPAEAASAMPVPTTVLTGATYVVPANSQALFTLHINIEGTGSLDISGALVEVT